MKTHITFTGNYIVVNIHGTRCVHNAINSVATCAL